jgi:signal transduction histidine kinase
MIWSRGSLLQRLVIVMSAVAVAEIGLSSAFLYVRFESANDRLREETLSTFADEFVRDVEADPQMSGPKFSALAEQVKEFRGGYAVIGTDGKTIASTFPGSQSMIPASSGRRQYFLIPSVPKGKPLFGISEPVEGIAGVRAIQIAFPRQPIVFDTVLEEFVGDIAWLWIPFILLLLLANIAVLSITLKPLRLAAEEASRIEPSRMTTRLTEGRMPKDVLALVCSVNAALDRLQAGFLAMDQFAGHLAHELRTPLAIAKARAGLLPEAAALELEADFVGMERVITQLVDRVRVGTIHFEAEDIVDLNELSSKVARFMAPMAVQAGRRLELDSPETPVTVGGAADYLFRALRNLIENAIRYSPPGGLISIEVFKLGISVRDNGSGFTSCRLGNDEMMADKGDRVEGLGLGLKIVSETMIAHGGRLVLSNNHSGGACATMIFGQTA